MQPLGLIAFWFSLEAECFFCGGGILTKLTLLRLVVLKTPLKWVPASSMNIILINQ